MNTLESIKAKLAPASGKVIDDLTDVEKKYLAERIIAADAKAAEAEEKAEEVAFPDATDEEAKLPTKLLDGDVYELLIDASDCTESSGTYTVPTAIVGLNYAVVYAAAFGSTGGGYVPVVAVKGESGWTLKAAATFTGEFDYFIVRYIKGENSLLSFTIGGTTYEENDYLGPDESGTSHNATTFTFAGPAPQPLSGEQPIAFYNGTTKIGADNAGATVSGNTWTATTEWSPETAPDKLVLTDVDGNTYEMTLSTEAPTTTEEPDTTEAGT